MLGQERRTNHFSFPSKIATQEKEIKREGGKMLFTSSYITRSQLSNTSLQDILFQYVANAFKKMISPLRKIS